MSGVYAEFPETATCGAGRIFPQTKNYFFAKTKSRLEKSFNPAGAATYLQREFSNPPPRHF
jgi:hypothetical protein